MLELADPFDDFDAFVEKVKHDHATDPALPPTAVFAYHDRVLSALVVPPAYTQERADEITTTLVRSLPTLRPDGVRILLPAAYDLDQQDIEDRDTTSLWWAMKLFTWERLPDGSTRRQGALVPMPVNDQPDGSLMDMGRGWASDDPLAGPVLDALDQQSRAFRWFVDLRWIPDDWQVLTRPGGRLDQAVRVDTPN